MPSRKGSKGRKRLNAKNTNKKKPKNTKKRKPKNSNATIAKIEEIAESKYESDDEYDDHFNSEHYLTINKSVSSARFTSIDCLSSNDIIPLKHEAMKNPSNKQLKEEIFDNLRREKYKKWLIELKSGFNLLFYGVGSKKYILEDFGRSYCCFDPKGIVIRVNGYMDDLNIKQILDSLSNIIIDKDKQKKNKKNTLKTDKDILQRAVNIVNYLKDKKNKNNLKYTYYYLIINNIDGNVLRKDKIQQILSILANSRYIHLIASIDHIHSLLLWDRNKLSFFHWIYHEITTYKHYFEEMEFERESTIKLSNNNTNHGLEHIMSSLTPGHRDIIQTLAQSQNENDGIGLSEDQWYEKCEDLMLVSNELKFQQYITEFIDHNVIITDTEKGKLIYTIPYDKQTIQTQLIDYELNL